MKTYIAFLRGINVGGHHKVPMADLKIELQKLGSKNVVTILNSGNIIFEHTNKDAINLEQTISTHLKKAYNFPIPTIIRSAETIQQLLHKNPFKTIEINKDIRLYISFLKEDKEANIQLPWSSNDLSYKILNKENKNILSVLNLSLSKTTKAMAVLEKYYGKNITTRNWNTILRIEKILPK